ncbi:hypothetical protein A33Q_2939 [Indibacter alkaliphilus LW1]|jgi:uncharacterized protein (DUF2147 family)|uniref:DUF2147 domain-containing protein n=1 Tax=Indibacter alkaliphilus (strain CCUG 57479 / KCTC 22604 / LW1) TaxID=1189612 RepID=S2D8R2_INDAL|nr:DUF2147 domain-containing protein [Indibacter alkaliphilus]EOZ95577.1 hypothetical protein A33Q_2939 [Indibacter alkaliphilus LW1]
MNNYLLTLCLVFTFSGLSGVLAQSPDDILGEWYTTEKDAKIEIFKIQDKYHGRIIWMEEPEIDGKPILDENNSDKSKRARPILGMKLLEDFKFNDGKWEDGTIYDPRNGKNYSCTLKKKDAQTLEVRGYVGVSLIGRTVEWSKAK